MINLCPHPPILSLHRPAILRSARKHSARNVRIFGSVARKEADQDSDIDFLVDMEHGRSLFDIGGLLMVLQEAIPL